GGFSGLLGELAMARGQGLVAGCFVVFRQDFMRSAVPGIFDQGALEPALAILLLAVAQENFAGFTTQFGVVRRVDDFFGYFTQALLIRNDALHLDSAFLGFVFLAQTLEAVV